MRQELEFFLTILILLLSVGLHAGAPVKPPIDTPAPGKPTKLETPGNVTCTKVGDEVTVQWDVVSGAAFYRVTLEVDEDQELTENVLTPPYTQDLSEITDDPTVLATAKVRAMRTKHGKGASKSSEAIGCVGATQLPAR